MKTSVVLATYNGEKYIREQLLSILNQTEKVDEVLIQDDCSNDRTLEICKDFIESNNLDWAVLKNEHNKGFEKNFLSALKKVSGDVVFLCDQDDVWKENKVQTMKRLMKDENILSLATTVDLIDENGKVYLRHLKHPNANYNGIKKVTKNEFLSFFDYLGMTMAIRKSLVDCLNDENDYDVSHDVLINFLAVKQNGFYYLDKALTERRSVKENHSYKVSKKETEDFYGGNVRLRAIAHRNNYLKNLIKINEQEEADVSKLMEKYIQANEIRIKYLSNRSIGKYIKNIKPVTKTYGLSTYVKDGINILRSKCSS